MEFIDHKDLKNELFESEEVKEEYEKLNVMYEIKKQIILFSLCYKFLVVKAFATVLYNVPGIRARDWFRRNWPKACVFILVID